ncbi:hypothetical protein [Salipaludibacillus daqingensis]|uniref:hypothetical protein n=1 Tax=Salipaludibacillus daqingensis TaxID=3041001 RepID=UPI0024751AC5|nr:hypothetical protein [Salipaludibacillus daqingensis]
MKTSNQSFMYKWHRFWVLWHDTKHHYYGSIWHEKRKEKHEKQLRELIISKHDFSTESKDPNNNADESKKESAASFEEIPNSTTKSSTANG